MNVLQVAGSGVSLHCGSGDQQQPRGSNKWEGEKSFVSGAQINANNINTGRETFHCEGIALWLHNIFLELVQSQSLIKGLARANSLVQGKWLQALLFGLCRFSSQKVVLQLTFEGLCCLISLWNHFKLHQENSWSCWSQGSFCRLWCSQGPSTPAWPLLIHPMLQCQLSWGLPCACLCCS